MIRLTKRAREALEPDEVLLCRLPGHVHPGGDT
jgi:hypothetical protein